MDRYQQTLNMNYKSTRNRDDLVPLFKPLHAKTISILEMVRQYNTVTESQKPTQRMPKNEPVRELAQNFQSTRREKH